MPLDLEKLRNRRPPSFPPSPKFLERVQHALTTGMMFIVTIFLFATVWVIYRPASLSYTNLPFPVAENRVYHPGETVPVMISRCSTDGGNNIYSITRGFNNVETGKVIVLTSTKAAVKFGCRTTISYLHEIPKDLPPGTYTVIGTAEVPDVFGMKVVDFESQPFEVK